MRMAMGLEDEAQAELSWMGPFVISVCTGMQACGRAPARWLVSTCMCALDPDE